MLKEKILTFIVNTPNCTRPMVIKEFSAFTRQTIYKHINNLIDEGAIHLTQSRILTTEIEPVKQLLPDWSVHRILLDGKYDAKALPFISEFILKPDRFRAAVMPLIESHSKELTQLLINLTVLLTLIENKDLSDFYPIITPADREQFSIQLAKVEKAIKEFSA